MMDRLTCEELLARKMKDIADIYKEYNPEGRYLSLCYINNSLMIVNSYGDEDKGKPIDYYENLDNSDNPYQE